MPRESSREPAKVWHKRGHDGFQKESRLDTDFRDYHYPPTHIGEGGGSDVPKHDLQNYAYRQCNYSQPPCSHHHFRDILKHSPLGDGLAQRMIYMPALHTYT
jgi:hypothetical protein